MRVMLSLSGGLDSAVLCASLLERHGNKAVLPVFFRYGSKHNSWEERSARKLAEYWALDLLVSDLGPVFGMMRSALLRHDERPIPTAAYDAANMAQTLVPGRNLIFASVMAGLAESGQCEALALATHAGDHALYPDCRPSFNTALALVIKESSGGSVRLLTPFSAMDKTAIVALGRDLDVPFALTRSCYSSLEISCGLCGTCRERLEAFAANGLRDPLPYAG